MSLVIHFVKFVQFNIQHSCKMGYGMLYYNMDSIKQEKWKQKTKRVRKSQKAIQSRNDVFMVRATLAEHQIIFNSSVYVLPVCHRLHVTSQIFFFFKKRSKIIMVHLEIRIVFSHFGTQNYSSIVWLLFAIVMRFN